MINSLWNTIVAQFFANTIYIVFLYYNFTAHNNTPPIFIPLAWDQWGT